MPRGKRKSKEQWCALVNEYTESGQTVEQFSLEAGISTSSLYKWMSKLNFSAKASDFVPIPMAEQAQVSLGDNLARSPDFTYISPSGAILQWSGQPPHDYRKRQ